MHRACKVTLKFATAKKRRAIVAFLEAYRAAVNFYIRSLWGERGRLDAATLARLGGTRLSARAQSQALKQALDIIVATCKAAKATGKSCSLPLFRGAAVLDAKFVTIEDGRGVFDLIVRLSLLHKGHRVTIPTKRTAVVNKWLARPLAKFIQGCALSENKCILWIDLPDLPVKKNGRTLGVDIGVAKLLVDSDGRQYGADFRAVRDRVRRRRPGSKAKRRAIVTRDNFVNRIVKQLPWATMAVLGVEALCNLKKGKKKGRGKAFRKAMAPWTYRRVLERLGHKAQENRVCLIAVPAAYTSRTCPACGMESKENRKGEKFQCVACNHSGDADHVGALNVLARTLATTGSVESPVLKTAV